ncbi:hypothetical protein AB0J25_30160 [Streptomyces sp. NPDC049910]|uniref:hypothetical protein n=1 Tax=Streptomyces sp. NPDC049910 TaxID=3155278 RepID=UPI00344341EA
MLGHLDQFGSPTQIRKAGRRRLVALIRPKAPRMAERLAPPRHRARTRGARRAAEQHDATPVGEPPAPAYPAHHPDRETTP